MNIAEHEFILAERKSSLIPSISQQKDSTQQRSSMEQASAKAHWLILKLNQSKATKGSTAVDKLMTLVVETMLNTTKDETSVRSVYVIPLNTARIENTNELI